MSIRGFCLWRVLDLVAFFINLCVRVFVFIIIVGFIFLFGSGVIVGVIKGEVIRE